MSDLIDVQNAMVSVCAGAIYPNGTAAASIAGVDCKIFPGWPDPADLDASMAAGTIQVSVYPMPGMDRNTTRYGKRWQQGTITVPTLSLTVENNTVTVSGSVSTPQTCLIVVNGHGYDYSVQSGDTLTTIAAGIAAAVPNATASGAIVTIPGSRLQAHVSTQGTISRELRRQERVFQVNIWTPTYTLRDTVSSAIDLAFSKIEANEVKLPLPDDYYARLIYRGTVETDDLQRQQIYKRALNYSVEYATTEAEAATVIGANIINTTVSVDPII